MKTTKEMVDILLGFGNEKEDMWQLKKAIRECNLTLTNKKTGEKRKIKNEEAVEILGMKTFLSGISRAAFHASASRDSEDGNFEVSFDLYKWWRKL